MVSLVAQGWQVPNVVEPNGFFSSAQTIPSLRENNYLVSATAPEDVVSWGYSPFAAFFMIVFLARIAAFVAVLNLRELVHSDVVKVWGGNLNCTTLENHFEGERAVPISLNDRIALDLYILYESVSLSFW